MAQNSSYDIYLKIKSDVSANDSQKQLTGRPNSLLTVGSISTILV